MAVLYAEGIDGKPDYKTAAEWFRRAADYGVADSQYNLAILYARGIGVDQNILESYKWLALAALQGDNDAAKKRDEIALEARRRVAGGGPQCGSVLHRAAAARRCGDASRRLPAAGIARPPTRLPARSRAPAVS